MDPANSLSVLSGGGNPPPPFNPGKGKRGGLLAERFEMELPDNKLDAVLEEGSRKPVAAYDDSPNVNRLGWVQTPQYFKPSFLMEHRGDPLSHSLRMIFEAQLPAMDGYDSCSFVGTNCVWRRSALDSVGGLQYGTVSEDTWTALNAFALGWQSAYFSKEHFGLPHERFRLAEGNTPDNMAASLAQRKRWHLGSVEMLLGVNNARDPEWSPPAGLAPTWPTPLYMRRYRRLWWFHFRFAFVGNNLPPLFYVFLSIWACWRKTLFISTDQLPLYTVVIPRLIVMPLVSLMCNNMLTTQDFFSASAEYFTYAPIRVVGTFEAVYAKITGKQLKWGNTGGIRNGSLSELYVITIVVALVASILRYMIVFLFVNTTHRVDFVFVILGFAMYTLSIYWPFARVSIQEYLGWSYDTMDWKLLGQVMLPAAFMLLATMLRSRGEGW